MPYLYNTPEDQAAMLAAIGAKSIDELFAMVPADVRLQRPLAIPPAMSELELTQHMTALAAKNVHAGNKVCFLGGGSYDHFIPAVIDEIAGRGEFYTSYTPYQAEVSQGNLQVVFEYQTLITQLTGLDVSNASLYDGGSAAAEAVLMAVSSTKRFGKVIVAASVHPEYRQTIATYLECLGVELVTVGTPTGVTRPQDLAAAVDEQTACIVVQQPNFFGCIEDAASLATIAHDAGALVVAAFDPISLGLLKRPGRLGRRYRGGRGPHARHAHAIRRTLPGHHGLPRKFGPPHAGPHRWPNRRPTGEALFRAHAANPRATHPPRKSHEQRLHEPGPVRAASYHLPGVTRSARIARNGQPVPAEIPIRGRANHQARPF